MRFFFVYVLECCNEKADYVSLRKLIMDMEANFNSRFDHLDTSMNGMSSQLEKVESELKELKDSIGFRIQYLAGKSSGYLDPATLVKNPRVPPLLVKDPSKSVSSHPLVS